VWAYKMLEKRPDKISWYYLSKNSSKWTFEIIKNNLDKTDWLYLSSNISLWAYKILKTAPDKISWYYFLSNPYIFKIVKTTQYYKLFDNLLHKKLI